MELPWLDPSLLDFPSVTEALDEPNGLLAVGGDLSVKRLLEAYRRGIFPWYESDQPILWWSPSPRCVLFLDQLHVSKSLRRTIKRKTFSVTADTCFAQVMRECAAPRDYTDSTWITDEMLAAYTQLHDEGYAHSIEVWQDGELKGGLYGVALGQIFFGESMFSIANDASKVAMVFLVEHLRQHGFQLLDCQVESPHIMSLGASVIARDDFQKYLVDFTQSNVPPAKWQLA